MNKKAILIGGAVLVVAAGVFVYSQYGVELGKFFAAEPGVSNSRLPQFSITNLTTPGRTAKFVVGDTVRMSAHWLSNLPVKLCFKFTDVQGTTSGCNAATGLASTDRAGNWHTDQKLKIGSIGKWEEWVKIGGLDSNHVAYTVVAGSSPTPPPSATPTPFANYLTGTLMTNFSQPGLTTNYAVNVNGTITPLFINANITDSSGKHLTYQDLKSGMTVQVAGAQNPNYSVRVWDVSGIIVLSYPSPTPTP